ncbi:MAG TPA: DNA (cytosine-5-)-methyltransferase [Solirubrobacteraceae bacterium]|jgi:DNA (cytosine-5)-methyltransferase 1|nr:DNA (cytosine-5-)-methyltransferase [Solirubrobacteraceae bacterium]
MVAHHRGAPKRPAKHPQTPDGSDLQAIRSFVSRSSGRPTAIELFCGAGGLSLGLERAGFDVLAGADSDQWAVRTHDANLPGLSWCGDLSDPTEFLTTLNVWGVGQIDLLAGGVPCQPFSRAGSSRIRDLVDTGERAAHDHRADLWSSFVKVVEALRPAAVLVENVPDLVRWNDGAVLMGLHDSLDALGYQVEARVLDGFRYGIPQHRQRLILIGIDGNRRPRWPEPTDQYTTLRDAIGDLPPIPRAQRCERLPYDVRRQTSDYQRLMRQDLPTEDHDVVLEHICRDVRPDDMEAFRLLGEGQTYIDLPDRLRRYRSDVFTDKYKRLSWSELCRTITAHIAKDGYWYIHPDQHRTLSLREAARVQSFPDNFRFAGTQSHRYRQVGNAVPVLLGEAIGRSVKTTLEQSRRLRSPERERFRELLVGWRRASDTWSPPWRRDGSDPWLVLAAELVLARMRPSDAEGTFERLSEIAPRPTALLAHDDPKRLLAEIGLTQERAVALLALAEDLVTYFDGAVPNDETLLPLLPGVGEYTGGAALTFAFGRRQVLLDQTTARVAGRLARHGDTRRFQVRLDLHRLAGSAGPDAEFNRALLDLGRELCRPAKPRCEMCPLHVGCATGRTRAAQADRSLASPRAKHEGLVAA